MDTYRDALARMDTMATPWDTDAATPVGVPDVMLLVSLSDDRGQYQEAGETGRSKYYSAAGGTRMESRAPCVGIAQ